MRALTIHQPYASAIAYGPKRVENRGWGNEGMAGMTIAIHSAARKWQPTPGELIRFRQLWPQCPKGSRMLYGYILATAKINRISTPKDPLLYGDRWVTGPKCWVLHHIKILQHPIQCRGNQGLWKVPDPIAEQIHGGGKANWKFKCECGSGLVRDVLILTLGSPGARVGCVECAGLVKTKR